MVFRSNQRLNLNKRILKITFAIILLLIPLVSEGRVLTSDTVWKGDILVTEDVLVPKGITLTISPGTVITVTPSESTKTDPEYMSPLSEITVRGTLEAEGTEKTPILFLIAKGNEQGTWGGIIIDGGTAHLRACSIKNAETGIFVIEGSLDISDCVINENRYGLVAQGEGTVVNIKNTLIKQNDYGVFSFGGAKVENSGGIIRDNTKKDSYSQKAGGYNRIKVYESTGKDITRQYRDEALLWDTVWQGKIEIDGIIRVPEGSRLIITPGTLIEFKKRDTDGDGIGENGLLIQGVLIAKGTEESPILFRSAEKKKNMGDWDAINIMNSDGAQNLIEYCQIEDAYRGLHFHFSNVAVKESVLRNNYRGVQFQESIVEIAGDYFYGNKSGIQARDSEIIFMNNYFHDNYYGAKFFRTGLLAKGNRFLNNLKEGLRIREGFPVVEENIMDGNRYGIMVSDTLYGDFKRNVITNNLESGISFKHADNIEVSGNYIQRNGINGINIQDSMALIKSNDISGNGERGIGIVSFNGVITENNFVKNGTYAIGLDGKMNISAPMNWWGNDVIKDVIYDNIDEPGRGTVEHEPSMGTPIPYSWPLKTISADTVWHGDIYILSAVQVLPGATLTLTPDTKVIFSEGTGLRINGKIIAKGRKDSRIIFTSFRKKGPSDWDEILLEHAMDSMFSDCDFEYATWGIHSHFTNLVVAGSNFRKNYGGMRFQSGPLEIKHSFFEGNAIGLRSFRGIAVVAENVFTGNETGIFIREKGGGLNIMRNNIFENSNYNLRIGDFNDEDVSARENYWGKGDPAGTIFDERREPGIGRVHFDPYAKEPFNIE